MPLIPAFVGGIEQGLAQERSVIGHDFLFDLAFALSVAGGADGFWCVEDEQVGGIAILVSHFEQFAAWGGVERGTIGYGKAALKQTFEYDIIEEIERVAVHLLITHVIANEGATMFGRNNRGCPKAPGGKGA